MSWFTWWEHANKVYLFLVAVHFYCERHDPVAAAAAPSVDETDSIYAEAANGVEPVTPAGAVATHPIFPICLLTHGFLSSFPNNWRIRQGRATIRRGWRRKGEGCLRLRQQKTKRRRRGDSLRVQPRSLKRKNSSSFTADESSAAEAEVADYVADMMGVMGLNDSWSPDSSVCEAEV